jgi:hypothetical protein
MTAGNGLDKPSEQTTRPDGNSSMKPSQLERGIGANAAEKLRRDHPDQNRRIADVVARKRVGQDGHSRR